MDSGEGVGYSRVTHQYLIHSSTWLQRTPLKKKQKKQKPLFFTFVIKVHFVTCSSHVQCLFNLFPW